MDKEVNNTFDPNETLEMILDRMTDPRLIEQREMEKKEKIHTEFIKDRIGI